MSAAARPLVQSQGMEVTMSVYPSTTTQVYDQGALTFEFAGQVGDIYDFHNHSAHVIQLCNVNKVHHIRPGFGLKRFQCQVGRSVRLEVAKPGAPSFTIQFCRPPEPLGLPRFEEQTVPAHIEVGAFASIYKPFKPDLIRRALRHISRVTPGIFGIITDIAAVGADHSQMDVFLNFLRFEKDLRVHPLVYGSVMPLDGVLFRYATRPNYAGEVPGAITPDDAAVVYEHHPSHVVRL